MLADYPIDRDLWVSDSGVVLHVGALHFEIKLCTEYENDNKVVQRLPFSKYPRM